MALNLKSKQFDLEESVLPLNSDRNGFHNQLCCSSSQSPLSLALLMFKMGITLSTLIGLMKLNDLQAQKSNKMSGLLEEMIICVLYFVLQQV